MSLRLKSGNSRRCQSDALGPAEGSYVMVVLEGTPKKEEEVGFSQNLGAVLQACFGGERWKGMRTSRGWVGSRVCLLN